MLKLVECLFTKMQLVWLKKDLRDEDHAPLFEAARTGAFSILYIVEPSLWAGEDISSRHYHFTCKALTALKSRLEARGLSITIAVGEAVDILSALHAKTPITRLLSHEECGNWYSYQRDKAVRAFTSAHGIIWDEFRQFGFERGNTTRNGWAKRWHHQMLSPLIDAPSSDHFIALPSQDLPSASALGLEAMESQFIVHAGRDKALHNLNDFLSYRGRSYRFDLSSPLRSAYSGSHISAHLTYGNLSMKEVYQASLSAKATKSGVNADKAYAKSLSSFSSRLHWHCHFIQKLEDEPQIEFRNFHHAYDGLRDDNPRSEALQRWQDGMTGYPMIDACMRSLIKTGWLNFRMRAMLVSFASYHLWLDWRLPARHLARLFTDYEPGIHYSQCQMQSGTTGINALRIYNPIKQSQDQDPDGHFIRKYCPELRDIPTHMIHTPWLLPHRSHGYPEAIVDEKQARLRAARIMHDLRKAQNHRQKASEIVEKHGSRKSGLPQNANKPLKRKDKDDRQIELPL